MPPPLVAAGIKVFELLTKSGDLRDKLNENTLYFRTEIAKLGFDISGETHSIVPIMLYDAKLAKKMADRLLELGIYCIGFSFPVVPKDKARISPSNRYFRRS